MVRFVYVACANSAFVLFVLTTVLSFPAPFQLRMFSSRQVCLHGGKNCLPPAQFVKGIQCIRAKLVEKVFVSELNVLPLRRRKIYIFLGWDANRSVGYCLPCAGAATVNSAAKTVTIPITLNQLPWKTNLWTRSVPILNIEPACELAYESDSGEDKRF